MKPRILVVLAGLLLVALLLSGYTQCHGQEPSCQAQPQPQRVYFVPAPGPANCVRRILGWPLLYTPVVYTPVVYVPVQLYQPVPPPQP